MIVVDLRNVDRHTGVHNSERGQLLFSWLEPFSKCDAYVRAGAAQMETETRLGIILK